MILWYGGKQSGSDSSKSDGVFLKTDASESLPLLVDKWREKIQLIYLDPPFFTGKKFSFRQKIGKEGWQGSSKHIISHQAYADVWDSRESFLDMLQEVLTLSHQLLKPEGSMFLHLDYRFSAHARLMMDKIFGESNFLNEIVWAYQTGGRTKRYFSRKHDTILFYRKSDEHYFNADEVGKPRGTLKRNNMKKQIGEDGRVFWSIRSNGKEYRYYEDSKVYPSDVWDDISHLHQRDPERTGYDTQKPEALMERILLSASRPGDWIGDFFAGSGTTPAVAQKNGRKWIAMDMSKFSIHVCRKRLLQSSEAKFFCFSDPKLKAQKYEDNNDVEIKITKSNEKTMEVQLLNYQCEPLSEFDYKFFDYIDYWSIGYIRDNEFFSYQETYRSAENPYLKNVLVVGVDKADAEKELACHIIDIYGKQFLLIL
ncbi:MAG TPA: hypothetical protein DIW17_02765 [Clostridiales bacterium]|nr:hypothetical protein [Clostridiales bacterium]